MRINKKIFAILLVAILANSFFALNVFSSEKQPEAVAVVEGLHDLLIKSMKSGHTTTCKERYELLYKYIKDNFDFSTIARLVLGRNKWSNMTKEEKSDFINAFIEMTVSTYASRFDSFSGEKFKITGFNKSKRGHLIVSAVLIKKDKEEIEFKYILRKTDGKWKIVSVSAKGVNDLSVKRADYKAFLKEHSIKELIKKIREKALICLDEK